MSQKLADPVHFFNSDGTSSLSNAFLAKRVKELEAEVDRLKRLLVAQVRRNQELQPEVKPTLQ